jgi:hypothetical protein
MKQFVFFLIILSLLLFGAWGCSENPEQTAKGPEQKPAGAVETTQAGTVVDSGAAKEKAKKVIEQLQATPQGTGEDTKSTE